jgi:hypothetical protein
MSRADVHTGGPVTVRSALIRHLVGWGVVRLASRRLLLLPRIGRIQAQMQALHEDVEAARQQHPDDRQAEARRDRDGHGLTGYSDWRPSVATKRSMRRRSSADSGPSASTNRVMGPRSRAHAAAPSPKPALTHTSGRFSA